MEKFKFVIGDWSDDGHGKKDYVYFKSNKSANEIREAYWKSCFISGVAFHHSDYGNMSRYNHMTKDYANKDGYIEAIKHRVLCDHDDNIISAVAMKSLRNFGLTENIFQDCSNEDGSHSIVNAEDLATLLLWFIGKSIDNFQYSIIQDKVECINGFWSSDLNTGFGYGLYG